jgi:UTP:GlnB (protein PII) uridylyltransferase
MGMHLYQVRSVMDLVTADRPGLLVNVVRILKDISVNVVSAEADTIVRSPRRVLEVEGRRV